MIICFLRLNRLFLFTFLISHLIHNIASQAYSTGSWPSGYYGYNRDYPPNGYSYTSSNLIAPDLSPSSRNYYNYGQSSSSPSPWNYGIANKYTTNYYDYPASNQYEYPYSLTSSRYSISSYPYSQFWRYYNQYPTRNQFSGYSPNYSSNTYTNSYNRPYSPNYSSYSYPFPVNTAHNPQSNYYRDVYNRPPHTVGGPSPSELIDYSAYPQYSAYPLQYPRPPTLIPQTFFPPSMISNYPQSPSPPPPPHPANPYNMYPPPPPQQPPPPAPPSGPVSAPGMGNYYDYSRRIGWLGNLPAYNGYNQIGQIPGQQFPIDPLMNDLNRIRSIRAVAEMRGHGSITGTVIFRQIANQPVSINGKISGLTPGPHGMHILEMSVIGNDCLSGGEHYNPQKTEHGGKHDWNRHVGDLGNIYADSSGVATFDITDLLISLSGGYSVINRTLVITEKADDLGRGTDLGSKKDGNSGPPIACAVIRASGM